MIKSPSYAMAWSMLKGYQFNLLMLAISLPIVLILKLILGYYLSVETMPDSNKIYVALLTLTSPLLVMIFTFGGANNGFASSVFPKYTFIHPISSFKLAIIPIAVGILLSYFYYIAWFVFIVEYQFSLFQLVILFSCVSGCVSWIQVIGWRYSNSPYMGISLFILVAAIYFVLFVSSWGSKNLVPIIDTNLAYLVLLVLPLSGILLAINSVARSRINENQSKNRYLSNVGFIGFNLPKNYPSITNALFRFEWRIFGWILPMNGVFISAILIFVVQRSDNSKLLDLFMVISFGIIYLPWFLPNEVAKSELTSSAAKTNGISSFITALPVSNFELAMAKLKLVARSIGVFHFMVLLTINTSLIVMDDELLMNPWTLLKSDFGIAVAAILLLGMNLVYPIIGWVLCSNTLAWCLKGERFFIGRRLVMSLSGLILILLLGVRFYSSESLRQWLVSYLPFINGLVFVIIALYFIKSFKRFKRVESMPSLRPFVVIAGGLFVIMSALFYTIGLITVSNPHGLLILIDLVFLGLLPFLTSPFSVAENRAR